MGKIPTAEELFKGIQDKYKTSKPVLLDSHKLAMIEFAKMHCEAQLKAILENVKQEIACDGESTEHFNLSVKPSILNSYPLTEIR
jgi:hypothetical protein